ncbi:hypothetical protein OVA24_10275 [Luteolibacter sp. SL250]|uniref:hypothetical protein n=1 Tax=Luteolibacter sp. SL250 TaxID=2995170 RepID=UPI00227227DA|nr:hypothetical protein [Luteolibacter sp. SL250]WAC21771.1 hypothetical protein OVA24_10275 [Luteolibacter sp. SL250]
MKTKTTLLLGSFVLLSPLAYSQTEINITGATAFRAAAHEAIRTTLTGTQYAYNGGTLGGASQAIFKGTLGGQQYIVRTSFSGSGPGIASISSPTATVQVLDVNTTVSTNGTAASSPVFQSVNPRWSFSDVEKNLAGYPNASLGGGPVGIVPFMFIASRGATTAQISNMTTQAHNALWSRGQLSGPSRYGFNFSPDTFVLATGRSGGSGTRFTILAETGYGTNTNVAQWTANASGELTDAANGGYSGSGDVRNAINLDRSNLKVGGSAIDAVLVSYMTVSDAITISGYSPATGASTAGAPVPLSYNGVRYSPENVRNGSYTLWGYQQLYTANISGLEVTFDTAFRDQIAAYLATDVNGTTGIAIDSNLKVSRVGGDGGPVVPTVD